jgi:hypothetical protein
MRKQTQQNNKAQKPPEGGFCDVGKLLGKHPHAPAKPFVKRGSRIAALFSRRFFVHFYDLQHSTRARAKILVK